jgi:hypothetical protein
MTTLGKSLLSLSFSRQVFFFSMFHPFSKR